MSINDLTAGVFETAVESIVFKADVDKMLCTIGREVEYMHGRCRTKESFEYLMDQVVDLIKEAKTWDHNLEEHPVP